MNLPHKPQMINIYKIGATISVIATILLGWLFLDDRFAHASVMQQKLQYVYITVEQNLLDYQINDKTKQLNYLRSKKDASSTRDNITFTEYDQRFLEVLERDLDRYYIKKENLSKLKTENIN